jgi:3-isopropylmalate dehydrogenase
MADRRKYRVAWLPGDGIGREVTHEALRVITRVSQAFGFDVLYHEYQAGGVAIDHHGTALPDSTLSACLASDAVLLGALGGPPWDGVQGDRRPEAGLLRLRKELGVFANLRPVSVPDSLAGSSPLRPDVVAGTDMMIVRELTGGIYFGEPKGRIATELGQEAHNTMRYSEFEVERIARVAFQWARGRRRKVTSVDKANVLEVSRLWREVVTRVHAAEYTDVALDHLYVDNAAMQIVRRPSDFDVIVTGNLFGDILSDLAATLPGSLGMLPSASIGGRVGLFEPVHGSAPDIAGEGKANPLAAILSGAMMLEYLGEVRAASSIRHAVDGALEEGLRTADLYGPGLTKVSTEEMGTRIADLAERSTAVLTQA